MANEQKTQLRLEIAHVLFMDIVGYSKLLIDEQTEALQALNEIVRNTEAARAADAAGQLIILPTGDGMALVFTSSVEDPTECALQISEALREQSQLPVRMGIHSGPVHHVADVNQRENIAGAGINIAQRIMDCGDAGHILLSKRVADDLVNYRRWQPFLHELGEFEVKHGLVVSLVNLYGDAIGNPNPPARLKHATQIPPGPVLSAKRPSVAIMVGGFILLALAVAAIIFGPAILKQVSGRERNAAPGNTSNQAVDQGQTGSAAAGPIPEKSIAVLPFENFSDSKENEFFADGVQDDILTALAKVADLKVISRTSVMSYGAGTKRNLREIAHALGVSHVIEGSVRRSYGKVRVSAQLIDARNDAHIWADTYDRDLADVFAIQSEIAKAIVEQLQAKLSAKEKQELEQQPTKDITAHDLYVRAKLLYESAPFNARRLEKFVEAAGLLSQAIARDPDFLLAHSLLSSTHCLIYFYGLDHTPSRVALAETAVNAVARLRPDSGEAHLARAEFLYRCYLDYDQARQELVQAQRALPNNAQVLALTAFIDRRQSRWEQAVQNLERALALDPRNWYYLQQASVGYHFLRRYADEVAALDRVMAILPNDVVTRVARAWVELESKADSRPLHDVVAAVTKESPGVAASFDQYYLALGLCERDAKVTEDAIRVMAPQGIGSDQVILPVTFWKGLLARMQGDSSAAQVAFGAARAEVEKVIREQPDYASGLCVLAMIDAGLGRKEEAIKEGRRACELLPITKDSINGIHIMEYLCIVYAWVGEKDLAIEQLKATLPYPGLISYGDLKLHPFWDPLHGDPRFESIAASLAPK